MTDTKAFTLAEVLITLGIIGVVAAMTLPTLIAKYQENVLINQGKRTLSILNNAYQQTLQDYGISNFDPSQYTPEEITEISQTFLSKLNIIESHENEPLIQNGIIPNYTPAYTAMRANPEQKEIDSFTQKYGKDKEDFDAIAYMQNAMRGLQQVSDWKYAYYLNDETCIIFYPYEKYNSITAMIIDTNGKKGPNKWGYDLLYVGAQVAKPIIKINHHISEKGAVARKIIGME